MIFRISTRKYINFKNQKQMFFNMIKSLDINFTVKIGNKANILKTTNPFEICRIDIKGKDSLIKYKL